MKSRAKQTFLRLHNDKIIIHKKTKIDKLICIYIYVCVWIYTQAYVYIFICIFENPRDRGAWWTAVYGVTQNWTRLKQLCSNSSSMHIYRTSLVAQTVKHLPEMLQSRTQLSDLTFFHFHNAGDMGSIPGLARSSGEGNGNPL